MGDERDSGSWTPDDHFNYYLTALKIAWGTKSPREAKRMRKRDQFLVLAIEGVIKYDRR